MSSSATKLNDCENGDCVQQPSSSTSGVPSNTTTREVIGAPRNATTTQASRRQQGKKKRSSGSTSLAKGDGQPSSSEANINPPGSRSPTPRRFGEDDMTTADRAISDSQPVHGTSDFPLPPAGRRQESRNTNERPGSSSARADGEPFMSLEIADREPGSSNTMTAQASGRREINRKRLRGSSSFARADGQPSSREANANLTSSRRTTPRQAISESPLVRGTSDVPLPPRGKGQGSRSISRRNTRSSRTYADASTPTESDISGTQFILNLRNHPSVHARAGQNPSPEGLYFRGAWRNAVKLYRAANDQYKQLFKNAGFEDFLKIDPVELPQGYLIALMERWFSETNTLHLPCCELGPTPLDWTMITGLRFGGQPIELPTKYDKGKVQKLLGLGTKDIFSGNRICLSKIKPEEAEVMAVPPTREAMESIFRRLFLYVIGSCLFGNSRSVIHHELVQFLEDIDAVGSYDWGAVTYAAFLVGMRSKVTKRIGAFTAFWQFLLFWAFEYLNICRPEHAEEDMHVFPRAMRWNFAENLGTLDNSELTASRFQLDDVDDEAQVTWQPYFDIETYNDLTWQAYFDNIETYDSIGFSITLAKSRVRFMSFDTWEYYLGERCRRQLGLSPLVPHKPPEKMHEQRSKDEPQSEVEREDLINTGISSGTLVRNDIADYASWFRNNSIGKIVNVTELIGGPDIGRKVMRHWMAEHRPDMILVPKSEVKEIREALGTANAEREKLQKELSRVRRGARS
ncbi:hypothetical protein POM88_007191 [Heracleum sosnowskyi]|uniref:Aminotransferase-like plant mobile domain-containing protein n=1 Tax=Heracleum sosnowskyi TaxID=360622 RepID=A0AAD8J4Y6_9APIA|nr:hypothetical protein POM88_007191 [Heracleum sosnowskyi]